MKTCADCHFLVSERREFHTDRPVTMPLTDSQRETACSEPDGALTGDSDTAFYSIRCYMGVWDENIAMPEGGRGQALKGIDRSNGCFFFPYRAGMLPDAAVELQKREEPGRQQFYMKCALLIAAAALVLNAIATMAIFFKN